MYDQYKKTFIDEAYEMLAELETNLLKLEETPEDKDLVRTIFRDFHTIKGSGQMFGFDEVAKLTHEVETLFDMVRDGNLTITNELINLALSTRDQINTMIDASANNEQIDHRVSNQIIELLKRFYTQGSSQDKAPDPSSESDTSSDLSKKMVTYHIHFKPGQEIFGNGTDPILLLNELMGLGTGRIVAHSDAIPALDSMVADSCYTYWDIILTTDQGLDAIDAIFVFLDEDNEIAISAIDENGLLDDEEVHQELSRILYENGILNPDLLEQILTSRKQAAQLLTASDDSEEFGHDYAELAEEIPKGTKENRQAHKQEDKRANIRVSLERLDSLMDLVGEMIIAQARLSQVALGCEEVRISAVAEEIERLSKGLRDETMNIRMIPLGTTFSRFKRLVRDLSLELGKDIVMTTQGGETELDKTVIEQLNDPLVHLIRNCVDHAIETPEARQKAGKPGRGTVSLSATHSGAEVLIKITDDGVGLDKEALREKAAGKGLIQLDAELTDQEVFELIFFPGFSMAQKVTNVSGRGVGMDVVKSNIESLRGTITVESQKGEGTTITLKLPLTLAIIDGLLLKVGSTCFVLPLSFVKECVELSSEKVEKDSGRRFINLRGELVPYMPLREFFRVEKEPPDIQHIVIVEVDGCCTGLVVDQVIGGHQTVLKSLGKAYKEAREYTGATILADGTVALILDIHRLVQGMEKED